MKIARVMTLPVLLAAIVFSIAQAQRGFPLYDLIIEIEPPQPTSNDEVLVHVSGQLPNTCYRASFSKLTSQEDSGQVTFSATVRVTRVAEICLQVLVPIGNTYNLGKLAPGEYEFILWGCLDEGQGCSSQTSQVLAHLRFSVGIEAPPPSPCVTLSADKAEVIPGDPVTFTLTNNCSKTSTLELFIEIRDGLGNFIAGAGQQITLGPKSNREVFSFIFTMPGEYTITATLAPGGTQSLRMLVSSNDCLIPHVLDINRNNKLDDPEIIQAIDIWVRGANVPGCNFPTVKLSDTMIVQLIDLWIRQESLTPF